MKIITVWQPWATLIAIGAKPYEFRGWPAPAFVQGQRAGIHAGKRKVKLSEVDSLLDLLNGPEAWRACLRPELAVPLLEKLRVNPDMLPHSAILCTAIVGKSLNAFDIVGEFGGAVNDSDRTKHANYAWPLSDVVPLLPPVEAKGAQGLWNYGGAL